MVASQATEAGSIPVPCSKAKQHPMGCCFCVRNRERKSNPFHASARWALAVRQLDAERSLRFASRANRPSIPVPCSKTKQHPIGMLFCFGKKGRESNPSNASARWALAVRQLDAERSLRFAPKGKSAIDSCTLLQNKAGRSFVVFVNCAIALRRVY